MRSFGGCGRCAGLKDPGIRKRWAVRKTRSCRSISRGWTLDFSLVSLQKSTSRQSPARRAGAPSAARSDNDHVKGTSWRIKLASVDHEISVHSLSFLHLDQQPFAKSIPNPQPPCPLHVLQPARQPTQPSPRQETHLLGRANIQPLISSYPRRRQSTLSLWLPLIPPA